MGIWGRGQKFSACSQNIVNRYFFILLLHIGRSNHPLYSQSFSSKQKTSASVPKSSHFLFNSSSPATVQKPVNFISHICGLGASVGCERVERTFNAPRLKAQIWLMKFTGFVCCLLNELNYINSLWRIVSYIRIVADTAAFRDSTFPFIGIFILWSASAVISSVRPFPSFPIRNALPSR